MKKLPIAFSLALILASCTTTPDLYRIPPDRVASWGVELAWSERRLNPSIHYKQRTSSTEEVFFSLSLPFTLSESGSWYVIPLIKGGYILYFQRDRPDGGGLSLAIPMGTDLEFSTFYTHADGSLRATGALRTSLGRWLNFFFSGSDSNSIDPSIPEMLKKKDILSLLQVEGRIGAMGFDGGTYLGGGAPLPLGMMGGAYLFLE